MELDLQGNLGGIMCVRDVQGSAGSFLMGLEAVIHSQMVIM